MSATLTEELEPLECELPRIPDLDEVEDPADLERTVQELGHQPSACLLCGQGTFTELFQKQGKSFWSCTTCDLVFVHDIYPEFSGGTEELRYVAEEDVRARRPSRIKSAKKLLRGFEAERSTGRLLEVGCGAGAFLGMAKEHGWDCTGVEFLPENAEYTRKHHGVDVRVGSFVSTPVDTAAYDVVYMNEVIEHVVDPVRLMRKAREVLRPGGLAVLRTGNACSWSARYRGASWRYYHFAGHGHIRYYSPGAAVALARAAGFRQVESSTSGFAFAEKPELKGRWYGKLLRLPQSVLSTLAGPMGRGHRLTMRFRA